MLATIAIFPTDRGSSVSADVARAVRVIEASGLPFEVNAMGTVVEGEPDAVFTLLRDCHAALAPHSERIYMTVAIDDRRGATGRLRGKLDSLAEKLGHRPGG